MAWLWSLSTWLKFYYRPHCTPNQRSYPDQRQHCAPYYPLNGARTAPRSAPAPRLAPILYPDQRPYTDQRPHRAPYYPPNSARTAARSAPTAPRGHSRLLIHQPWQGFICMPSVYDSKTAYALGIARLYTVAQLQWEVHARWWWRISRRVVVRDITPGGYEGRNPSHLRPRLNTAAINFV